MQNDDLTNLINKAGLERIARACVPAAAVIRIILTIGQYNENQRDQKAVSRMGLHLLWVSPIDGDPRCADGIFLREAAGLQPES